jgi:hypothetical protein
MEYRVNRRTGDRISGLGWVPVILRSPMKRGAYLLYF